MKKAIALSLLLLCISVVYAQDKIAKGYVLDGESHAIVPRAKVNVLDTTIINYTDSNGFFSIDVPKRRRHLEISKENYAPRKIALGPGFQHKTLRVYLQSPKEVEKVTKMKKDQDSLFLSYKNTLSLSLIELIAVAIAGRYERFITPRHSIGMHGSFYVYGNNINLGSEYGYYNVYHGFKLAPGYRFYPFRNGTFGAFLEAKVPIGYFYFSKLNYHYSGQQSNRGVNIKYSQWTAGYSISAGISLVLSKTKHIIISVSAGYQYFPIDIPETAFKTLSDGHTMELPTDVNWWYNAGPGSKYEIKVLIGKIF
jgi:hypothetical protein